MKAYPAAGTILGAKLPPIPNLRKYPICLRDLFSELRSNDECFYTANLSARNTSESLNLHPNIIPTTVPASNHGSASLVSYTPPNLEFRKQSNPD